MRDQSAIKKRAPAQKSLAMAPLSSSLKIYLRCAVVKAGGRPGGEANLQRLLSTALQGIVPTHHRTRGATNHAS